MFFFFWQKSIADKTFDTEDSKTKTVTSLYIHMFFLENNFPIEVKVTLITADSKRQKILTQYRSLNLWSIGIFVWLEPEKKLGGELKNKHMPSPPAPSSPKQQTTIAHPINRMFPHLSATSRLRLVLRSLAIEANSLSSLFFVPKKKLTIFDWKNFWFL